MSRSPSEGLGPRQESVWDYPRPPRVEPFTGRITVELGGVVIASTRRAWRVLETSHPPTYYLPRDAFADGALRKTSGGSWCEWKGRATYYDLIGGGVVARKSAWSYLSPTPGFEAIAGAVAVMAANVDRCTVNGEVVVPQPGGFYGGWITSWVTGPFKGVPGSTGW
ncbi:hypothetical protein A5756_16210 [Mycobacterium sp. 852002-53434_SCH5985345]|uniref:DUF427 domain-containing protein n=1 Tax=unclassified Mycobacterium TaxID=2642494 RepID=UPI0008000678|nr:MULTISPECIES: DUF427 domain-containing protein [unclassified Mycobacterium]OBF53023.1 hypothetical protein A5756_16210 [Mycobacterium sp. 852002-53434_SCH5985345]OBF73930.1 hypothetical protein A5750_13870 [Mycobacterium sp. 852002-51613_SCH5001154]